MSELLCYTEEIISDHLRKIQSLFVPNMKLTLIARDPNCDTADFLLTGDNLPEVAKLIQRRMTPEEIEPLAEIGRHAAHEHKCWAARNGNRSARRSWLISYLEQTGEWFNRDEAESEDAAEYDALNSAYVASKKALFAARAATRRAIVRAAAEIGLRKQS